MSLVFIGAHIFPHIYDHLRRAFSANQAVSNIFLNRTVLASRRNVGIHMEVGIRYQVVPGKKKVSLRRHAPSSQETLLYQRTLVPHLTLQLLKVMISIVYPISISYTAETEIEILAVSTLVIWTPNILGDEIWSAVLARFNVWEFRVAICCITTYHVTNVTSDSLMLFAYSFHLTARTIRDEQLWS